MLNITVCKNKVRKCLGFLVFGSSGDVSGAKWVMAVTQPQTAPRTFVLFLVAQSFLPCLTFHSRHSGSMGSDSCVCVSFLPQAHKGNVSLTSMCFSPGT